MSEFRQYRLASQLFDRFNCLRDPNSYTPHLFGNQSNFNRVIVNCSSCSSVLNSVFLFLSRRTWKTLPWTWLNNPQTRLLLLIMQDF
jgi:hypothetical protein